MDIKECRVLVVGMAKSGIEAARLALKKGARVSLYDAKEESALEIGQQLLEAVENVYFGGAQPVEEQFDYFVLSPGVPPTLPFIENARARGVTVIGEIEFAYRLSKGRFVGITGTNGKTTTTALTAHILKSARIRAQAVGNIGAALSGVVDGDDEDDFYVVELSSYQLETVVDLKLECAAILNVTPDHLSRHKTMQGYIDAKLNIAKGLPDQAALFLNLDNEITRQIYDERGAANAFSRIQQSAYAHLEGDEIVVDKRPIASVKELQIRGDHNVENALAAAAIAAYIGLNGAQIKRGLTTFKGVAHRNELVLQRDQMAFYNDSKATNPEATIMALKALERPTVLIAGGMDKGSDYSVLFDYFEQVVHVVLIGETKRDIAKALDGIGFTDYQFVDDMEQAVAKAIERCPRPGNVLLSPACASWDMYANFEVRGDHFKTCVLEQMG